MFRGLLFAKLPTFYRHKEKKVSFLGSFVPPHRRRKVLGGLLLQPRHHMAISVHGDFEGRVA